MLGLATVVSAVCFGLHIYTSVKMRKQIQTHYRNLRDLGHVMISTKDHVPNNFSNPSLYYDLQSVADYHDDVCVLVGDLFNLEDLYLSKDPNEFLQLIEFFYERMEQCIAKYNVFKIYVQGSSFAIATGIGELHSTDHVIENVRKNVRKINFDLFIFI